MTPAVVPSSPTAPLRRATQQPFYLSAGIPSPRHYHPSLTLAPQMPRRLPGLPRAAADAGHYHPPCGGLRVS